MSKRLTIASFEIACFRSVLCVCVCGGVVLAEQICAVLGGVAWKLLVEKLYIDAQMCRRTDTV